jgi:aspartate/methionine/tyrosine aminotransferase
MSIHPFKLERYFAKYEFSVEYLLSPSDCESLGLSELFGMADPESLALWNDLRLSYTESPGHPLLREEIARLYPRLAAENMVVAVPEEAIFIAMHTLLEPGDGVISVFPAYQSLYEIARSRGVTVKFWEFELGARGWQLDLDWLEDHIDDRTRLLVVNFPHNPTGYQPSREVFDRILELAQAHELYLLSDEMYRLLEYEPENRLPPVCSVYEKGISLSGLSKTFALPGLRLGWLATQATDLVDRWLAFKDYTTICNSAPSEILGIIALRAKDRIIRRNLEIIVRNLEVASQFFSTYPGNFDWIEPVAGSTAFPRLADGTPVESFCEQVLEQKGVMIVPGSIFDFPGDHFRVGLGRRNLAEALSRVGEFLEGKAALP